MPQTTTPKKRGKPSKAELQRQKKIALKMILFVVLAGFFVLCFASLFAPGLEWLKSFCYTVFGLLMYVMPFLLTAGLWFLLYGKKTDRFFKRTAACILLWFAASGMLSIMFDTPAGGLLGRAGTAIFLGILGPVGLYVLYAVIALIGVILFVDLNPQEDEKPEKKENPKNNKEAQRLREEREELSRQNKELKATLKETEKNNRIRTNNDKLQESIEKEQRKAMEQERFKPIYGIGDTLITDDAGVPETILTDTTSALKKNEELFAGARTQDVRTSSKADNTPNIRIPQGMTSNEDLNDFEEHEFDFPESDLKIVETANGKQMSFETDGDILAGKKRYSAENPPESTEFDYSETRDSELGQMRRANAGKPETDQEPIGMDAAAAEIKKTAAKPAKPYTFPPMRLLKRGGGIGMSEAELKKELNETADKLVKTLEIFGIGITITDISCGPTVTRYEFQPELGIKVSQITNLEKDIKLSLAASDIRMEAPIPGKSAIGIEIPNRVKQGVMLRDILESDEFKSSDSKIAFGLGRDVEGKVIIGDIEKMPHVLVAGATGSGKSVCINSIIMSILYHALPTEVQMILIDPKVVELSVYNGIPHLMLPVVTDPKKAASALNWAVGEMERRYQTFAEYGVRNLAGFNAMVENTAPIENGEPVQKKPTIVIIIDELADLMMAASKEVETAICRIAQKGRASGVHLVVATQRPSVDVITGLIKANIPSRIAFAVSSGTDSRTILDTTGAERLLGRGDMLYAPAGATMALRVQGSFVSDDEVKAVVDYIAKEGTVQGADIGSNIDLGSLSSGVGGTSSGGSGGSDRDEYFAESGRLVIQKQKASIGMLQRAFKLGFNRAARVMDQLADAGVVGEEDGTKPRQVLMTEAQFEEYLRNNG